MLKGRERQIYMNEKKYHYLMRVGARVIDLTLVSIITLVAFYIIGIDKFRDFSKASNFTVPFIYSLYSFITLILFEAILTIFCATTIGKFIYGMKVVQTDDSRLKIFSSFRRAFLTFVSSGMGIWVFMPVTIIYESWHFLKHGTTSYDKIYKYKIIYDKLSLKRLICAVIATICSVAIIALIYLAYISTENRHYAISEFTKNRAIVADLQREAEISAKKDIPVIVSALQNSLSFVKDRSLWSEKSNFENMLLQIDNTITLIEGEKRNAQIRKKKFYDRLNQIYGSPKDAAKYGPVLMRYLDEMVGITRENQRVLIINLLQSNKYICKLFITNYNALIWDTTTKSMVIANPKLAAEYSKTLETINMYVKQLEQLEKMIDSGDNF